MQPAARRQPGGGGVAAAGAASWARRLAAGLAVAVVSLAVGPAAAGATPDGPGGPDAAGIVAAVADLGAFGLGQAMATVTMSTSRPGTAALVRRLEVHSRREGRATASLVRFLAPPEVAGSAFLALADGQGGEQQYLYLPALAKTKRIAGRQRDEPFLGSDLSFGDVQARHWQDADLARLADVTALGAPCWVVEARPRRPQEAPYARVVMAVHSQARVPVKVTFFAADGAALKQIVVRRLRRHGDGYVAAESVVSDLRRGSRTTLTLENVADADNLPATAFTPQGLAAP